MFGRRDITLGDAVLRCLRLRCPACGRASIVARPFQIKDHCPACGVLFKREEGFFVGAVAINLVTTEAVIIVMCIAGAFVVGFEFESMLGALLATAFLFPFAFYHHSWSAWLTFDHIVERLPEGPASGDPG
jgi:uncharacterized protein (DUF983 family)